MDFQSKTTISNGSLALGTGGSISNSGELALNGGNFNVSALASYTLGTSQKLTGNDRARSIPPIFRQILVEGSWIDGRSLPDRR